MNRIIGAAAAALLLAGCGVTVNIDTPAKKAAPSPSQTVAAAKTTASWPPATVTGAQQVIDALKVEGVECATGWQVNQYDQQADCASPRIWVFHDPLAPGKQDLMESTRDLYTSVFVPGGGVFSNENGNWIIGADDPAATTITAAVIRPYA